MTTLKHHRRLDAPQTNGRGTTMSGSGSWVQRRACQKDRVMEHRERGNEDWDTAGKHMNYLRFFLFWGNGFLIIDS